MISFFQVVQVLSLQKVNVKKAIPVKVAEIEPISIQNSINLTIHHPSNHYFSIFHFSYVNFMFTVSIIVQLLLSLFSQLTFDNPIALLTFSAILLPWK